MSDELPELTPKTFEAFMDRVRDDPAFKVAVTQGIAEDGFVAVVARYFQLSDRQRELLEPLASGRGAARYWEQNLTTALLSGGDISLVHEGRDSTDVEIHVHIGIVDFDVSIHC